MNKSYHVWLVLLLLVAFAPVAFGDEGRLKIACYNLENLLDVWDDPYTDDESTDVKPHREIKAVANVIDQIDADIVAVSEVENEGVLRAMTHGFLIDKGYDYIAVSNTNDGRGVRIGLLSRKPILSLTSHHYRELSHPDAPRRYRFARDLMQVKLQVTPSRVLHLFVVHFKSMRDSADDPRSELWRSAEALGAREVISEVIVQDPSAWVALVGDLNSLPDSPSLNILLKHDIAGKPMLLDMYSEVPARDRITYLPSKFRSNIDYILTSPPLAARMVKGSTLVIKSESMLGGSDHAPLAVTFDVSEN